MKSSTRIIVNTIVSYGRSLFAIFVALFSTRWILEALGHVDFGLFGLVGSLIALISILNNGLSVGVTRFYAFAIGEGENDSKEDANERLLRWFNAAFSIHALIPILFVLIGWPIGEYAIKNWLVIPDERLAACLIVFRVSLITAFLTIFSVPFISMYMAHQRIAEISLFGVLRSCLIFLLSWCLLTVSSDKLVFYAYCMVGIAGGITLVQIIRAMYCFPACRPRIEYMFNKEYIAKLFTYSGWKMLGMGFVTLRMQGTPMLINLQFGPVVNAAYGLAFSLSSKATMLSESLTSAFRPAVISSEGKGERVAMLEMALRACKFGSVLVILFAVPLIVEMNYVLELWLKNPPMYVSPICQWLLAMLIVERMTTGQMLAVNARGKIAKYEIIQGFTLFFALPLMWLFFRLGSSPVGVGIALFISMFLYCVGRILFAKYLVNFPIRDWIYRVALPVSGLILIITAATVFASRTSFDAFMHISFSTFIGLAAAVPYTWFVILDSEEQFFCKKAIKNIRSKFSF